MNCLPMYLNPRIQLKNALNFSPNLSYHQSIHKSYIEMMKEIKLTYL